MQIQVTFNVNDRVVAVLRKIVTRRHVFFATVALGLASAVAYAATVTHTFSAGDTLSAAQMNKNFSDLAGVSWSGSNASDLYVTGAKVGIGTTTPNTILHVDKAIAQGPQLLLTNSSTTSKNSVIYLGSGAPTVGKHFFISNDWSAVNSDKLTIGYNNSGSWKEHVVVTTGGNVGIGTTTPGAKLEVNGTINATNFSSVKLFSVGKGTSSNNCHQQCRSYNNNRGSCLTALGGSNLQSVHSCDDTASPLFCFCISDY